MTIFLYLMLSFWYVKEIRRLEEKHSIYYITKTEKREIRRALKKIKHG
jgi:hypothetical protein